MINFFLIGLISINIYCYIFYFDLIGHSEFQFLLSFILIFDFYDSNYDIIYEIQTNIIILVVIVAPSAVYSCRTLKA